MKTILSVLCPICNAPMVSTPGHTLSTAGVTVYCDNLKCSAQEVAGYGTNEKTAYEIVLQKHKHR